VRSILRLDPWQRRWLVEERVWWVADDAITRLARCLPALAEALSRWHLRSADDDAYLASAWAASAAPGQRAGTLFVYLPPTIEAAYSALGLRPGASALDVAAARRRLARRHHPDAGGEHGAMAAINDAADTAMRWLARVR
jgi:hypothetical protein